MLALRRTAQDRASGIRFQEEEYSIKRAQRRAERLLKKESSEKVRKHVP